MVFSSRPQGRETHSCRAAPQFKSAIAETPSHPTVRSAIQVGETPKCEVMRQQNDRCLGRGMGRKPALAEPLRNSSRRQPKRHPILGHAASCLLSCGMLPMRRGAAYAQRSFANANAIQVGDSRNAFHVAQRNANDRFFSMNGKALYLNFSVILVLLLKLKSLNACLWK